MEVNATGLFAISRAFLEPMMERGRGSVINIGSIQGVVAPDFGNYAGTDMTTPPDYQFNKHGLVGLTKALAVDLAPSVLVNAVAPGPVLLPEDMSQEEIDAVVRATAVKRIGTPEDVAGAVRYLLEGGDFITGQALTVDGGRSLCIR